MSKVLTPVNTASDVFDVAFQNIKDLIATLSTEIITANATIDGGLTIGNGYVTGIFGATTLTANVVRGGTISVPTDLNVESNVVFNVLYTLINGSATINSTAFAVGANVIANT